MRPTDQKNRIPVIVFDPSITRNNPTGSCLLKMLEALTGKWPVHTFVNRSDISDGPLVKQTRIPLPDRPELFRRLLFPILVGCAFLSRRPRESIRIATEAAFPICQISHTQFCHRYFLRHHRDAIATTWARRLARTCIHRWCEVLERIGFRYAEKIVVPSEGTGRELQLTYPKLTQGKIRVIPNPVDAKLFRRDDAFRAADVHKQIGFSNPKLVLNFCALGGFTRKGLPLVFDALADIRDPDVHLIVVGGRSGEIREFESMARRLHLSKSVHFVGLQSDVRPYLWCADVFILPSAYEGFPLVCLQAAAAGVPLISTPINGVEDFLIDGVNGWMVERTAVSTAAAIMDAKNNPEKRSHMGRRAELDAQAYDDKIFQTRWLELLSEFGVLL